MTNVKGRGKRAEKARATRRKILRAAHDLFIEHGYGNAALQDIADRAGVAVQTIYFTFGNKRALLKEVVDVAVAGDDEPIETMKRPWFTDALATETAAEQIDKAVAGAQPILERTALLTKVIAAAAAMDPDVADLWPQEEDPRYTVQLTAAEALVAKPDSLPELTVETAADLLYGLTSPELYLVLVEDRGWKPDRWRQWAATTLRSQLCSGEVP